MVILVEPSPKQTKYNFKIVTNVLIQNEVSKVEDTLNFEGTGKMVMLIPRRYGGKVIVEATWKITTG